MKRLLVSTMLTAALLAPSGAAQRGPTALATNEPSTRSAAPAAAPRYTVTNLGTLAGASEAFGLSDAGHVAGRYATGASTYQAFVWDDGVMQGLGTLGGDSSEAYGVNDDGQVAGTSKTSGGYTAAFRWDNGAMQNLGTLGGTSSGALGINNSGHVAGWAINGAFQMHALLWSGGMADLGALSGGDTSFGYGINDAGQVAGWGKVGTYPALSEHAFLWSGSMQDLGTLGWAHSTARGLNDNGEVVGYLVNANQDDWHAFVSQGGGMQDLGGTQSVAWDINNAGLIVGESGQHAVLWDGGQMQDLNTLIPADSGWVLRSARGINNRGQIVGTGTFNGQTRAFLLAPRAYYWINPSGGAWHLTTNWDPQGDPGDGDTVIFALSGQYAVDASVLTLAPATFLVDRMVISSTGIANVNSGTATFSHAIVGGLTPSYSANPPIARLQVFNSGTSLNGTGRLTIGDDGVGDLFVANGGQLTSCEARLGGLLPTAHGTAVVGGDGSLWETGNIAVGYGVSGTLTIESGGRVNSNDGYVSFGVISDDSQVTIDGIGAGTSQASMWALLGSLTIGQSAFGFVEVLNGGDLYVSQHVHIIHGGLYIEGRHANGDASDLDVLGSVFVGGAGSGALLAIRDEARGDIEGDLILGKDGPGSAILWGPINTPYATQLLVVDSNPGLCAIGREFDGAVSLDSGGLLRCRNIQLGQVGTSGTGWLTVDGGVVSALNGLQVGQVGGAPAGWRCRTTRWSRPTGRTSPPTA